jgi:hypothetical protein
MFVVTQVRQALQHTVAIGAFSPYFAAVCATRPGSSPRPGPRPFATTPCELVSRVLSTLASAASRVFDVPVVPVAEAPSDDRKQNQRTMFVDERRLVTGGVATVDSFCCSSPGGYGTQRWQRAMSPDVCANRMMVRLRWAKPRVRSRHGRAIHQSCAFQRTSIGLQTTFRMRLL